MLFETTRDLHPYAYSSMVISAHLYHYLLLTTIGVQGDRHNHSGMGVLTGGFNPYYPNESHASTKAHAEFMPAISIFNDLLRNYITDESGTAALNWSP